MKEGQHEQPQVNSFNSTAKKQKKKKDKNWSWQKNFTPHLFEENLYHVVL
jgi:hypothetical protein